MLRQATLTGDSERALSNFSEASRPIRAAYMQETTEQRSTTPAIDDLVAAAKKAGDVGRRAPAPQRRGSGPGARARNGPPQRARRGADRDRGREQDAVLPVEGALRAHARARARAVREASAPRVRHRAAPPPGGCARRDAHRADRGQPARGRGAAQRQRRTATSSRPTSRKRTRTSASSTRNRSPEELSPAEDPGRDPPLPVPAPDRVRQDDRRRGVRRGGPHDGRPHPHPQAPARLPVQPRARGRGLRRPVDPDRRAGPDLAPAGADHRPDVRVVRAAPRLASAATRTSS